MHEHIIIIIICVSLSVSCTFAGSLRKFMTNSVESNVKALPTEVARVLDLLRHPSITGFATRVGEGFATGIANSIRSGSDVRRSSSGYTASSSAGGAGTTAEAGGSILERFFSKSPKTKINAVLAPQKIENDGWKGIVEVLVMSLSTDKGKELAVSVTKAFSKELMRSWLEKDGIGAVAAAACMIGERDGKMIGQQQSLQQRKMGKLGGMSAGGVLRDSSNLQVFKDGNGSSGMPTASFQLKSHGSSNRMQSANFAMCSSSTPDETTSGASRHQMTLPLLAFELATTEYVFMARVPIERIAAVVHCCVILSAISTDSHTLTILSLSTCTCMCVCVCINV